MIRFSLSIAAAALVLAAPAGAMTHPKLTGAVGKNDAFVITLKNSSGTLVKTLKVGTYTFVVHDFSSIHSFSLSGPHGFAKAITTVPFTGTKTVTLTLKAGKYKYFCVAHPTLMFHFFTVK